MGSTPRHRLALATVTLALVAGGAAAPAQARPGIHSRMPAASSPDVTPALAGDRS